MPAQPANRKFGLAGSFAALCSRLVIGIALALPAITAAEADLQDLPEDGLELVEKNRRGEIHVAPGVDFNVYSKIHLEKASVAFRKDWARDQTQRSGNRVTKEDMERIKTELSDLLHDVFSKELSGKGDYIILEESGNDVMRITPHIVNLDIYAPDRMREHIGYSLTDSSGQLTLNLEIHDSVSGALLATSSDRREDRHTGYLEWTTEGANRRAARFMLERSAISLRKWLAEAREGPR